MLQIFAFLENLFPNAKDGLDAHPLILDIQLSEVKSLSTQHFKFICATVARWQCSSRENSELYAKSH